jgi:hypothetical protein
VARTRALVFRVPGASWPSVRTFWRNAVLGRASVVRISTHSPGGPRLQRPHELDEVKGVSSRSDVQVAMRGEHQNAVSSVQKQVPRSEGRRIPQNA